jgi:hypothetical protein
VPILIHLFLDIYCVCLICNMISSFPLKTTKLVHFKTKKVEILHKYLLQFENYGIDIHRIIYFFILLINNFTVLWFVQCPSRGVLYFGRLTFADCTITKNRLKNSNIFIISRYLLLRLICNMISSFPLKTTKLVHFKTKKVV